jgi:hypothetical protein
MLDTPVLFLIFNRPEHTQRVFYEIKKQRPKRLFVHADGPRQSEISDYQKCMESRRIIEQQIDWECDLHILFRDENLGCGKGPSSAISWFFDFVSEGIIIEDDCLPHSDFFGYCSELLDIYRDDERIMIIGATTYRDDYPCEFSYTFTHYGTMAAWATWKRVWEKYDYSLSGFSREELKSRMEKLFNSHFECKKWIKLYDWIVTDGFSSYWDWQLHFIVFYYGGIAIRPQKNMINNIGYGLDASHTNYETHASFHANRPVYGCLPLNHPSDVVVDKKQDSLFYKKMYKLPLSKRILQPLYLFLVNGRLANTSFIGSLLNSYRSIKNQF